MSSSKRLTYAWTPHALAVFRALAAEVERILLYLLTRLRINRDLAYRYPAVVAGVGAIVGDDVVVLVEMRVMILGRLVRGMCARLLCAAHGASTS
jgi:hypothetical protein